MRIFKDAKEGMTPTAPAPSSSPPVTDTSLSSFPTAESESESENDEAGGEGEEEGGGGFTLLDTGNGRRKLNQYTQFWNLVCMLPMHA